MDSSRPKAASSEEFWNRIEQIYGQIPYLIKLVLQINGFDSFLALKGIRNDEKNEFFKSLESTVVEFVSSDRESSTKDDLETEIVANHQNYDGFKLKPGHRNYIMNLMIEIDKSDVNEFFGRCSDIITTELEGVKLETPTKHQYTIAHTTPPATLANLIVRRSNSEKHIVVSRDEHRYSQENETEYVLEEEYLTDDTMNSMFKVDYGVEMQDARKRKSSSSLAASSAKRRPAQMYNEEFMAKSVNPRRRRVTMNKHYPTNDEGTRERFTDLIHQSMECILPRDKLSEVEGCELHVEKETETSWAVYCPLCHSRIRLPVVVENSGRYCNYKRSNFERHLRFKHCKNSVQTEVYEAVEAIEEIIE